ncbi:MAG: bacillithiol system redox-active protein YtxJ [Bacteroidetes bacterium]|nr:MAG: bacillithiol system redox-active protein YtxJ [Bacteroidota bacterium]TAG85953.1 MAG: bacillithiol system redox-active protein YtxJ [Bacteroidota bacterium]
MHWHKLTSFSDWDEAKKESFKHKILVFKHSTTCSISLAALGRFERKWSEEIGIKPYFLDLLSFRDISNQIAIDTKVIHQSPQIIVLENGESLYNASHNGIDAEDLLEI